MQSLKHRGLRFQASGLARESSPVLAHGWGQIRNWDSAHWRLWRAGDVDVNRLPVSPSTIISDSNIAGGRGDVKECTANCVASDLYNAAGVVSDPGYYDVTSSKLTIRSRSDIADVIEKCTDRADVETLPRVF